MTDDIGRRFALNTPITAVMELVGEIGRRPVSRPPRLATETAVSLIQPYAAHVAEELWERLGRERLWQNAVAGARTRSSCADLRARRAGGQKVRDRAEVPVGLSDDDLVARAKELPRVRSPGRQGDHRGDRRSGKLVNLVVLTVNDPALPGAPRRVVLGGGRERVEDAVPASDRHGRRARVLAVARAGRSGRDPAMRRWLDEVEARAVTRRVPARAGAIRQVDGGSTPAEATLSDP